MKSVQAAALFAGALPFAAAATNPRGFNMAAQKPDGSCKTQADWAYNFKNMKSLGDFTDVRVYASSDCNTLALAVPPAIDQGIKLLVGVWTEDEAHFQAEKDALEAAMTAHGIDWMSGISVGSEDLYRGDTTADILAQKVYDVRGMVSQEKYGGSNIPIGHVDTYNAWNASAAALFKAVDFVGMDAYPYWQSVDVSKGKETFQQALTETQNNINTYNSNAKLWITETGWPTAGPDYGNSKATVANGKTFWDDVFCGVTPDYPTWWYINRDYYVAPASQAFGVLDENFSPLFDLTCP
ncbi:glycoside hydrolase superfamily [Phyllosticta citriasiana]|uniref:Probable glucan endo-1,3-beta-glucosidase eglC n=2 Tax=Phyllosticta TaxID=121621 RepID=A0ABR1KQH6_9PEZI